LIPTAPAVHHPRLIPLLLFVPCVMAIVHYTVA
jgi:hypothetical protein